MVGFVKICMQGKKRCPEAPLKLIHIQNLFGFLKLWSDTQMYTESRTNCQNKTAVQVEAKSICVPSFWPFWQDVTSSTWSPCCSSPSGSLGWKPGPSSHLPPSPCLPPSPSSPGFTFCSSPTSSSPSTPSP